jgi:hypothetical protein
VKKNEELTERERQYKVLSYNLGFIQDQITKLEEDRDSIVLHTKKLREWFEELKKNITPIMKELEDEDITKEEGNRIV